ncbi:hypothetical protein V8G54_013561 [Vigna mungo]|uniref:Uncharacterized protein n=1 Tax=Vigna mungo TaxID=3915 RepID=A0AAQ3NUA7_VIGMU
MAGIAIVLDLWRKNQNSSFGLHSSHAFQSSGAFFSASAAATAAAASVAAGTGFASRALFGSSNYQYDALRYSTKQYNVELKPLFSAFELRTFAMTSIRSFLMFYLPLLEPRAEMEDDEDFLEEDQEHPVDLVVPLKKSVKQIIREDTCLELQHHGLSKLALIYIDSFPRHSRCRERIMMLIKLMKLEFLDRRFSSLQLDVLHL